MASQDNVKTLREEDLRREKISDRMKILKDLAKYALKYRVPRILFATAVIGTAVAFPPAAPIVVAAGAGIAYVEYKKKNPKATFKHYAKSGLKQQRNKLSLEMQATDIGQVIMHAKMKIRQRKNKPNKDELHEVQRVNGEVLGTKWSTNVYTDNAEKARRLNHIRWIKNVKGVEK